MSEQKEMITEIDPLVQARIEIENLKNDLGKMTSEVILYKEAEKADKKKILELQNDNLKLQIRLTLVTDLYEELLDKVLDKI